ncbi:MarR family winged helix-turn-helix transcriptional regulator [Schaalia naturae]|jgi:DNA-binding MarR family transcriptional regulator|uniref:MarR family winged helix-turn-helix transcriptional regulator n=1 Tax=Schaalia naturae TaxID=635203 RepID=A0ABW2SN74_9ACTO
MTRVTDHDPSQCPPLDLSDQLRIAVGALWRRIRSERSADDLNELQYSVLAHVVRHGPLSFTRLAADTRVTPTSITRVADHLEGVGLAERTRDAHDARVSVLGPTPAGTDLVLDVRRARSQWLSTALSKLSASDREVLAHAAPLLRRLAETGDRA